MHSVLNNQSWHYALDLVPKITAVYMCVRRQFYVNKSEVTVLFVGLGVFILHSIYGDMLKSKGHLKHLE